MRSQEEQNMDGRKEVDVDIEGSAAVDGKEVSDPRVADAASGAPEKEHGEKAKGYGISEFKEYITEIPFPIKEKTGVMRQFLSGIEKLFAIIKSSFRKAILWISKKNIRDEEKV
ncbi:hypothetical protein EHEL_071190 [Encephalitozoon hellem ATCC 50504]|uniref:Uncharacterized protein n=1 Tax=Encephalitozoon hellem TaxID=27973 RepID=A0A9Q9CCV2_ENCHE|nr:uncharacterized protein EHEL_071190 [Encephalitozoon hellem ATCC 50504]AFM98645.1 hypothetical protein EHEL_071190 [Encephalitozoon hellem ATCC 50504]UTX43594.1 hypothetical protein GPU96_07g13550 [Encephalitozoon hellem]WEL39069.1 hypothetical protein PFJ87_07g01470 [Encephalitozoon hellem]|eukprot:XP_003887626.1 hypothetical protein EHEL_071190 [Encephalitozoon hellem ATCC 50504]